MGLGFGLGRSVDSDSARVDVHALNRLNAAFAFWFADAVVDDPVDAGLTASQL